MTTIGQKLGDARREAGLSVEVIAHETRIHPKMIRSIEEDDFSTFPSVAYARSFVGKYADVLGLDLSDSLRALNSGVTLQVGENDLMGEAQKKPRKSRRSRRNPLKWLRQRKRPGKKSRPYLLNLILLVLMGAMAIFYFLGFHSPTPDQAREDIARGLREALPFAGDESATLDEPIPPNPLRAVPLDPSPAEPVTVEAPPRSPLVPPPSSLTGNAGIIDKPAVDLPLEEAPALPSDGLREVDQSGVALRKTPPLRIEATYPEGPIPTSDLPALQEPTEEPVATLRPAGTDPVEEAEEDGDASASERPVRAIPVPVVRSR